MTNKELEILTNIIGGVESGGQIYGRRRYEAYAGAYANSPNEVTCTLGWAQNYGENARELCKRIFARNTAEFRKADTAGIEAMLSKDWVSIKWNPNSAQKSALISIITTTTGKSIQDEMFIELAEKYITSAKEFGVTDVAAQMMWCEIEHLGGLTPTQRIFRRAVKPYTPDSIFASLILDQKDTSNNNQVGDKIYQSRHECCVKWIKQYVTTATTSTNQTTGGVSVIGNYDKYINSTGTHYISNCGHDERGAYSGGQAGDQTGSEWQLISWYSRPWNCVLRHPDPQVRKLHAEMASAAALNDNIGYDQYQRDTFGVQLKAVGDDPSKIKVKCETDCSKGIIDITKAIGRKLNRSELQNINATYTGNMRSGYKTAGYQVLTDSKYLTGTDYLLSGDILLNDVAHTATNITNGSKANSSGTSVTTSSSSTTLQKGSTGSAVKTLQTNLNKLVNAGLVVDGDFGTLTYNAVIKFQKKYKLTADGIVGNITQEKIDELLKSSTTSSSTATSSTSKLNETAKWTGFVTADSLNVRTWAGTEYSACSFSPLKYGTKVSVYDSVKSKDGAIWYFIKYNGKFGFVHSDYVSKI